MVKKARNGKRIYQNQEVRFAAKLEILAELGRLLALQKMSKLNAIETLLTMCHTDEKFMRLASLATGRTYSETARHVSKSSIYYWLRTVRRGGVSALKYHDHANQKAIPLWLSSFTIFLRPSVAGAYRSWIASGLAPKPEPTLEDVRNAMRLRRSPLRKHK